VNSPPQWVQRNEDARLRQAEQMRRGNEAERTRTGVSEAEKGAILKQRKADELEKTKTLEEINNVLAAPERYRIKYAEFLKAKNTGIARIFPDRGCDKGMIVDVKELERCGDTAQIKGAGSIYSFRLTELPDYLPLQLILSYIAESDIHFIDGKFVVGTESILDIIGDVGETDLASITLDSEAIKFLKSYKPGNTAAKMKLQKQTLAAGVRSDGYLYSSSALVKLNDTYVLRSIAFFDHGGYKTSFWNTDHLTAFKVVGQEGDGSFIILWKKLAQKDAPVLRK